MRYFEQRRPCFAAISFWQCALFLLIFKIKLLSFIRLLTHVTIIHLTPFLDVIELKSLSQGTFSRGFGSSAHDRPSVLVDFDTKIRELSVSWFTSKETVESTVLSAVLMSTF